MWFTRPTMSRACSESMEHVRVLASRNGSRRRISGGTVRVDLADSPSYDYKVFIENRIDVGWDGGNKEDRLKTVQLMFGERCRDVKVLEETPIEKGTYLTGKPAVTWVMKVKCDR